MSEFAPQPNALGGFVNAFSWPRFPLHVGAHAAYIYGFSWRRLPVGLSTPYPRINAGVRWWSGWAGVSRWRPRWAQAVSHHADSLRLRLGKAGFHSRRPVHSACFHFFPLSVGLEPTVSWASGAFTIAPSMLCHFQEMPSNPSYSANPRRQRRTKNPHFFHSWKYLCTELELPNTSFGKAFHWHPVLRTYTMAENTWRAGIGFLPPPDFRLYLWPLGRCRLGSSGSTLAHSSSETSQLRRVLMPPI
jgi:hypothetical protein